MSRPRIRSLKPENWSDEAVGGVSRDARLLRDVLITLADDDGRWRHLPSAILGHGYPYDDDIGAAEITRWAGELVAVGMVIVYRADDREYGCFPRWHLHQVIAKYKPSDLPPSDDPRVLTREQAARIKAGEVPPPSGSRTGRVRDEAVPHAQAPCSDPIRSLPDVVDAPAGATTPTDPLSDMNDLRLAETVVILRESGRLTFDLELMGVHHALSANPGGDHVKAAHIAVSNASDPTYKTTDAGRALRYAFNDLDRQASRPRGSVTAGPAAKPKPWAGALRPLVDDTTEAA